MKKILIVFSTIISSIPVSAQHVDLGLKGGLNIADFSTANNTNYKSRTSFHLGGLAHIHLSKHIALQPELMYSEQGARYNSTDYDFNYINVPVLLQFMAGNGFRIETGPQIGFLTTAKSETGNVSVDIKDNYDKIDFDWAIGASYLSPARIGIDARYNLGIANIIDGNSPIGKLRNNVFQLGAFYQFK